MTKTEFVQINGYPAVKTTLTVRAGAYGLSRSIVNRTSDEFQWLMGILEGRDVEAVAFSGTNVSGHTSEAQLREAYAAMNPENRFWIKEPQLEAVIAKFGDGTLGFTMSGMYCQQTPAEIEQIIAACKQESLSVAEDEPVRKIAALRK